MFEDQETVDVDSLHGIPSEELFEKLLKDAIFVDYLNTFLSLPVFGKRFTYNRADDNFTVVPTPSRTCYYWPRYRIKTWVRKERMKFFWKTDLFLEYLLCIQLFEAAETASTSMNFDDAKSYLGTAKGMRNFHCFLRGTTGQKFLFFWVDAEQFRRVTKKKHRRFAFRDMQAKYLRSGSPRELPEIMKWASICGGAPDLERKSSFKFPKSVFNRMYLSDASIFSDNVFILGQKMALERLISYWVPKFIEHKKKIRKLIEEKRGLHSEFSPGNRPISPVPEDGHETPVSKTKSEVEMEDFMEAHYISSTESVVETEDEIRARRLEEWDRWFWEGTDENQLGTEERVEPPKDMPLELRQLGGIKHASPSRSATPDSEDISLNVSPQQQEDETILEYCSPCSPDDGSQRNKGCTLSFSHLPRTPPVSTKERSLSFPAFSSAVLMAWHEKHEELKRKAAEENEKKNLEEKRVNLPSLKKPYALLVSSVPKKRKSQYEALASEQRIITEQQDTEPDESSTHSYSPIRSLSRTPPQTAILALRRASAARVIPFEEIGHEIATMVGEPRPAYPRETLADHLIPPSYPNNTDVCLTNQLILPALVALTADKLAGGPLREYLEKSQDFTALRSLQFWEDAQRYLSPLEDFGSFSKFHSAKTLVATYIAPDSPRRVALSSRVRDDLMRLLPGEKGDNLLSTVANNSAQAVVLPWSMFVRSDEDHFVSSVGMRRRSAQENSDDESDNESQLTSYGDTVPSLQALKLAAGFGHVGFSLGQDDEDIEELEALNEDFKVPSLKEKEMVELNARGRRASHFYGHVTMPGEDTSEGVKKITGNKIRPPKPRCFNDILHEPLHMTWFKRFLCEKKCEAPLLFWQAVESMKTNCKDAKARQSRAMIIVKKYFVNIPTSAVEHLHCKAEIIEHIPVLEKTTPPMLVSAQACVARAIEENWYAEYLATFPNEENEGDNFGKYAMRNTLAGVCKMAAHGKTRGLWAMFTQNIILFQRGIHHPESLSEFKQFLRREIRSTVEQNLRRHALNPTRRMINSKVVNIDRLITDLEFWMEVERFKNQSDYAAECARSGNYSLEDENLLLDKARTIVKCYIDSEIPPRVQINVPNHLAENIIGLLQNGIIERGLFHEAALSVFTSLMFFWKKFSAERFSQPLEELEPASADKRPTPKARIMSMVGGVPYRRIYASTDEDAHWSFSLSHGLRLVVPLNFITANRVATQLDHRSEGQSDGNSSPRATP